MLYVSDYYKTSELAGECLFCTASLPLKRLSLRNTCHREVLSITICDDCLESLVDSISNLFSDR